MLTSLINAVIGFIQGCCAFLANHTLKSIFVDPSSNPKLTFEDGKPKLVIKVSDTTSLAASLEEKVNAAMLEDRKIYAPADLNLYQNPLLGVGDYEQGAKSLNNAKKFYLQKKEKYLRNKLNTEIIKQKWYPINIYIVNQGSIATKSMRVIIKGISNLYESTKVNIEKGHLYSPPTGGAKFRRGIYPTPNFGLKSEEYEYLVETGELPIQGDKTFDLSEPIRQRKENRIKFLTLYIDTSIPSAVDLKWQIYEDTLGKNGNHGTLKIECIP